MENEKNINEKNPNTTTAKLDLNAAKTIGARIRALRMKSRKSQEILGGLIGVDKSTICNWENDNRLPSPEMITALAKEFQVSTYYLMYGCSPDTGNLLDLNGLTYYQMNIVREVVNEFRKSC